MKVLFFLIVALFWSCGPEAGCESYKFSLQNLSGFKIKIVGYDSNNPELQPNIFIINNDETITKTYENCPPGDIPYYSFSNFFKSDSIKVIFNTNKVLFFKRNIICEGGNENDMNNPLNECIYRNENELFIFTEEDYENAEPCNGDCE